MATKKRRKKRKPQRGRRGRGRIIAIALVLAVVLVLGIVVFILLRNTPERRYERQIAAGQTQYAAGAFSQAATAYETAVEINATDVRAYSGLVKSYGAEANTQGVTDAFTRATANLAASDLAQLRTETAAELTAIAERYFESGDYESARGIAQGLQVVDEDAAYRITDRVIEATAPAIGSNLSFGTWMSAPLTWKVLAREGDRILLFCDQTVETKPFTETYIGVAWEYCTLRKWLSSEFYNGAFTVVEQNRIVSVMAENPANPADAQSVTRKPTEEKIYILSMQEIERYFPTEAERVSAGGAYWTRTSAWRSESGAVSVTAEGAFQTTDARDVSFGVRPVLWLRLE
ncbi:MAG: hypothetical protein IJP92_13145 [Lachnospiraceae bacterium]|nr:hypothetical protein [Lachnospiraceae bacterium]